MLDIACGGGVLLFCMQHFGHKAIGIDVSLPIFDEMAALLEVDRRICPVYPNEPLQLSGEFDLITCIMPGFAVLQRPKRPWTCTEWAFFLSDVRDHLSGDGRFFTRMAKNPTQYGNEALRQALAHAYVGKREFLCDRESLGVALKNWPAPGSGTSL